MLGDAALRPPLLTQHRQGNYAKCGLAPCRRTPPFPLLTLCDFECSKSCDVFNIFDFSTCRPSTFLSYLSIHLIFIDQRSSLAVSHPILRCHYTQVFYIVVVAYHAGIQNQPWSSVPRNPLLLLATLVAHGNHGLRSFLLAHGI